MVEEIKFVCPNCQKKELDKVSIGNTLYLPVDKINRDGTITYNTNKKVTMPGGFEHYSCANCGYMLRDKDDNKIQFANMLVKWLKENCPQD